MILPLSTSTASEKVRTILLVVATAVALSAGVLLLKVGAVLSPEFWLPIIAGSRTCPGVGSASYLPSSLT